MVLQQRWAQCYADSWQGLIVPDAYQHPAKFSRGLIHRIYRHLLEQGYVKKGDIILDCFAGVALGALDALTYGLGWIGVELEPHFHALGTQNLAKWHQDYGFTGATLLQGDSRNLRAVLAGAGLQGVVGSPPFSPVGNQPTGRGQHVRHEYRAGGKAKEAAPKSTYGTTPGQLGAMPAGVVGSPPFHASTGGAGGDQTNCLRNLYYIPAGHEEKSLRIGGNAGSDYGTTPGQLGAMPAGVVGSPPFGQSDNRGNRQFMENLKEKMVRDGKGHGGGIGALMGQDYGSSPGQLGAMPAGVVGSPPFSGSEQPCASQTHALKDYHAFTRGNGTKRDATLTGDTPGQLGAQSSDTFWSAAAAILTELYHLLPPGAPCVWVLKAYVSKGKIVDFPRQWEALCHAHGFVTVEWIEASLVEHHGTQETLFGGAPEDVKTERRSFFRRLHVRKRPDLAIDEEIVLIMTKLE